MVATAQPDITKGYQKGIFYRVGFIQPGFTGDLTIRFHEGKPKKLDKREQSTIEIVFEL